MRNRLLPAALAAMFLALSTTQVDAAPHWQTIIAQDSEAVYAMAVGHDFPLDLAASSPRWFGTGFQLNVAGRIEEVTACHMVCYKVPAHKGLFGTTPAHWLVWPQVDVGPLGDPGLSLSYHAFGAATTTLYTNADVAVSTAIPYQHSAVTTYQAPKPVVPVALALGNFMRLHRGQRLLVLGNPGGTWTGAKPTVSYFRFEGLQSDLSESHDPGAHFPNRTLPVVLVLRGKGIGGMSGAPVINGQGLAVGVFVAAGPGYGYAVPLDPTTGVPIGGIPKKAAGAAE